MQTDLSRFPQASLRQAYARQERPSQATLNYMATVMHPNTRHVPPITGIGDKVQRPPKNRYETLPHKFKNQL